MSCSSQITEQAVYCPLLGTENSMESITKTLIIDIEAAALRCLLSLDFSRYAEIPREMLVSSNWILPQLNFEPYYDKPPLLYWLCGISYCVFGVSEWSARLVPAMAALCMFASTLWFGSRMFGNRVGLLSASVLMLSAGFMLVSRFLLIDGVFAALVTLSLLSAHEAIRTPRLKLRWLGKCSDLQPAHSRIMSSTVIPPGIIGNTCS
jgi:predicted membrane-bound mannosyltransferase